MMRPKLCFSVWYQVLDERWSHVFVILNSEDKSQVSKPRWLHWPDESTRLLSKVMEEESMGSPWSSSIPDGRRSWLWCRSIAWKDPLLMCFGFTSPPGPVSPDIWNDSILYNFGTSGWNIIRRRLSLLSQANLGRGQGLGLGVCLPLSTAFHWWLFHIRSLKFT